MLQHHAFVFDEINLIFGDSTVNPTLLVSQTVSRGKTTTKLYDFNDTPTGALSFKDGSGIGVNMPQRIGVKQHGNVITLIMMAYLSRRIH